MFTYRDMTFCNNKECKNKDCHRRLTDEVCQRANAAGMYIAVADFNLQCREDGYYCDR